VELKLEPLRQQHLKHGQQFRVFRWPCRFRFDIKTIRIKPLRSSRNLIRLELVGDPDAVAPASVRSAA
jgi:hypothetical protein